MFVTGFMWVGEVNKRTKKYQANFRKTVSVKI
jgi:hypothetical protein